MSGGTFGALPDALAGGAAAPPLALTRLDISCCRLFSVQQLRPMPALRFLNLRVNNLTELPDDLGQRLPQLAEIKLWHNDFRAVPLAALSRATSLEKIELYLHPFQPDEALELQLERLLGRLRRLQELKLSGSWGGGTGTVLFRDGAHAARNFSHGSERGGRT